MPRLHCSPTFAAVVLLFTSSCCDAFAPPHDGCNQAQSRPLFAPAAPSTSTALAASTSSTGPTSSSFDVIFSSGFLCFSRHAGFAASLEDLGLRGRVDRYVGTSSGSLAASMLAAGLSADEVAEELSARRPIAQCRPSARFWRGALSTRKLQKHLKTILPENFEDLERPLGVGVCDIKTLQPRLITSGPLVPAIAASCAVPGGMFAPVRLEDGRLYADGGSIDRTSIRGWRDWGGRSGSSESLDSSRAADGDQRKALVHLISSSGEDGDYSTRDGIPDERDDLIGIVHSPRTGGGLFGLGDFEGERERTRTAVAEVLRRQIPPF